MRYNRRMKEIPTIVRSMLFILRISMGIFFLYTGIAKVTDLGTTAEFLTRSNILPEIFSMPLACTGIAMEIIVAVCLIFRLEYRGATVWAVIMTSVFVILYIQAWARGLSLSCNCFGAEHDVVNYPQDITIRILILGAMLLLLWDSRHRAPLPHASRNFDFSEVE